MFSLNRTLRVLAGPALASIAAACVVATPPPSQTSPPNAAPPPPPEPVAVADPVQPGPDGRPNEVVPVTRPAPPPPPAQTTPAPPVSYPAPPPATTPDGRPNERVPVTRPAPPPPPQAAPEVPQQYPAPPPQRPNERVPVRRPTPPPPPQTTPPPQAYPPNAPGRPNEVVPIRRRDRLGSIAEFSIEPTAGPVGTTVTIYGDFSRARNPNQIRVSFAGSRRNARAVYVAGNRVAVVVPPGSRTGPVRVQVRGQQTWAGRFAVTPRDKDIFLPTPVDSGLLGAVYQLPAQTKRLPNFKALGRPYATIVVPSLKVSARRFEAGFPGLDEAGAPLLEWFGIRFIGMLTVPRGGNYQFRLNSDDGSRLYINGKRVVDNDGVHAPRARNGSINLGAGTHDIVVEYFQGPRFQIALELFWRTGNQGWRLVPPSAFSRYAADDDCATPPEIFCCTGNSRECRDCRRSANRVKDRWRKRCQAGTQPPQAPAPPPGLDCSTPPQRVCCQSNAANCRRCRREARNERQRWDRQCQGSVPPPPVTPAPINCSQPPQRVCCQAQTPQCNSCRQQAAAERAAWNQQCSGGNPPTVPIDCGQPPQRVCCQAQTPQCNSCRQQAAAERAAWNQQCSAGNPPGQPAQPIVDCSKPLRIRPCCKALTPACRECARKAQAQRDAWNAQCR